MLNNQSPKKDNFFGTLVRNPDTLFLLLFWTTLCGARPLYLPVTTAMEMEMEMERGGEQKQSLIGTQKNTPHQKATFWQQNFPLLFSGKSGRNRTNFIFKKNFFLDQKDKKWFYPPPSPSLNEVEWAKWSPYFFSFCLQITFSTLFLSLSLSLPPSPYPLYPRE